MRRLTMSAHSHERCWLSDAQQKLQAGVRLGKVAMRKAVDGWRNYRRTEGRRDKELKRKR